VTEGSDVWSFYPVHRAMIPSRKARLGKLINRDFRWTAVIWPLMDSKLVKVVLSGAWIILPIAGHHKSHVV